MQSYKQEPISTITNIAYVVSGIFLFGTSIPIALALIALGITSFLFHYTPNYPEYRKWQSADIISIFFVANFCIAYFAGGWIIWALAILAGIILSIYERTLNSFVVLPIQFGIILALNPGHWIWLFVIGLACNIPYFLQEKGFWRDLLHGVWHILTATGFYLMIKGIL